MTDSKETVVVKKARYSHFSHFLDTDEQGRQVVDIREDGFFLQIPLKPAYAVTIHKAQGMTLDRMILSPRRCFLPGQLYTALSRCRSLDGIFLTEPIFKTFCDPAIAELYDELEYSPVLLLDTLRRERETFFGLLFGVAFPDSEVSYGQAHPLLQILEGIWNQSLSRQRRGELPNLSDVVSARTASLLELIRSCIGKLRKSGSLDEWEFDRLVHWLLEITAPDECAA